MATTPKLGITEMPEQQANAFSLFNDFAGLMDALTMGTVVSDSTNAQPGSPSEGDSYIIPLTPAATGADWTGQEGEFTYFYGGGWIFQTPVIGWTFWITDTTQEKIYDGTTWHITNGGFLKGANNMNFGISILGLSSSAFPMIDETAYFGYIGQTTRSTTPLFTSMQIAVAGSPGGTAGELGVFSTPLPPNKSGQTLTKIEAESVSGWNSTGVKRNSTDFATVVPAGTHLWAGSRSALATSQPQVGGVIFDMGRGNILTLASSGALTASSTFAGVVPSVSVSAIAPYMAVEWI